MKGSGTLTRAYCRVSTMKQDVSIEIQKEAIQKYALGKGWEVDEFIVDSGISGKTSLKDRPQGRILFDGKTKRVIVLKLDRMGRSVLDIGTVIEEFHKCKIPVHILDFQAGEPLNTESPMGKMMVQILSVFAEFERSVLTARMKGGQNHAKDKGLK